jgi:phage tail-like protein
MRRPIERLLPAMYQAAATPGSVLGALLDVMAELHAPAEATLAQVDSLVAPYRAPDRLVPFLLRWVALDHLVPYGNGAGAIPVGRLRDMVAEAARLAQVRGTAQGLRALLETATGTTGFGLEEPTDRPFHLVVHVPAAASAQLDLIHRLVAAEKPASTTCAVVLDETTGAAQ